jgi:lysophospholipase L1-like esterase
LARLMRSGEWRGSPLAPALALTLAGYAAALIWPDSPFALYGFTIIGFGALVTALARLDLSGRSSVLATKPLVLLGTLSFPFYLIHLLVLESVVTVGRGAGGVPWEITLLIIALAVSLGAAWLLHRFVEIPGRALILGRTGTAKRSSSAAVRPFAHRKFTAVIWAAVLILLSAGVVAATNPPPSTTVVIGASISAGYQAEPGQAWPELVASDLSERGSRAKVVNASIGATRLLTSYPDLPSSLSREAADGLSVPGVTRLILTDMINDIQAEPHQYDPETIIAGIREFVRAAHQANVGVTLMTITPYGGYERYDPVGEDCRQAVNAAIRSGALSDDFIDADRVLADPTDPTRLNPQFDSGDHLHPNDAGHHALAVIVADALATGQNEPDTPESSTGVGAVEPRERAHSGAVEGRAAGSR